MRRPLPPELVTLGDQLERAARGALGRRLARRQQVLNAVAAMVVAVPMALAFTGSPNAAPVSPPAALIDLTEERRAGQSPDAVPPRLLSRLQVSPDGDLLYLPIDLRRALR